MSNDHRELEIFDGIMVITNNQNIQIYTYTILI